MHPPLGEPRPQGMGLAVSMGSSLRPSVNSHVECLLCVWGALGAPPPTSLQMRELAFRGIK